MKKLVVSILVSVLASGAFAQMSKDAAFSLGKQTGNDGKSSTFSNINTTTGESKISGFNNPPPQSNYWTGSASSLNNLYSGGAGRSSECADAGLRSGDPSQKQHCEAVEAIKKTSSNKPTNLITKSDPLYQRGRAVSADPGAVTDTVSGAYTDCSIVTKTSEPDFSMETCDEWSGNKEESCSIENEVVVDPDYIYSCLETIKTINESSCTYGQVVTVDVAHNYQCMKSPEKVVRHTCDKMLNIVVVTVPGCTPGTMITSVTGNPCPRCVDYIRWDFYCQNGYYQQHVYSVLKRNGRTYMDFGWANVPGTPGTNIGQTLGVWNTSGGYCYHTYYSQSCSGTNCTMGVWFSNPCQRTSYYNAVSFTMPTKVGFNDQWNDGCVVLQEKSQ